MSSQPLKKPELGSKPMATKKGADGNDLLVAGLVVVDANGFDLPLVDDFDSLGMPVYDDVGGVEYPVLQYFGGAHFAFALSDDHVIGGADFGEIKRMFGGEGGGVGWDR